MPLTSTTIRLGDFSWIVPRRCAITDYGPSMRRLVAAPARGPPSHLRRVGRCLVTPERRRREGGCVDVADRDRERVGGIVWRRHGRQPEQQLHHVLHLRLLRAAIADDGALDLGGRVL